jgi:hypothetical protein
MAKPQAKSKVAPREAVLVLGMYASGASAVTRVANLLGAAAPPYVVGGEEDGSHRSWQSAKLVALHEEILAALDSAADDWRPLAVNFRDGDTAAGFAARIRQGIDEEFGSAPLMVLKDPRLCRDLPLWMAALEAANIRSAPLIVVRNPLEVAASLRAHDGTLAEKSMLVWLRHYLDAEFETRHLPRNIVTLDALLDDWRSIMVQSAARLGIAWPRTPAEVSADVRAFLSHDLHRHRASKAELHASAETPVLVKEAYEALTRLCDEPKSGYAKRELDKIRAAFAENCKLFGAVAFNDRRHARAAEAEMHAAIARAGTADALTVELARLAEEKAALETGLADLVSQHEELLNANTQNEQKIHALEAALAQAKGDHAVACEAADELERRADAAEKHIAELLNLISELEQRDQQSQEALAATTEDAALLRQHAHDLAARFERIEKELQTHVVRSAETNAALDESLQSKESLLAQLQSGLLSSAQLQQQLSAAREEMTTHQSAALTAAADARKHAGELELAHKRIAHLEARIAEASAAAAKAAELQRMVESAHSTALRSSDDLQQATSEAEARLARLEEELRVERQQVLVLEKRLASWAGLLGAALRKASGLAPKTRAAGTLTHTG